MTFTGNSITWDNGTAGGGDTAFLDLAGAFLQGSIPTGVAVFENDFVLTDTLEITTGNRGDIAPTTSIDTSEISGDISGAGALIKRAGNGALLLTGTNTYTGGTTVNTSSISFTGNTASDRLGNGQLILDSANSGNTAGFFSTASSGTVTFSQDFEYRTSRNAAIRGNSGATYLFTSDNITSVSQAFNNSSGTDGALVMSSAGPGTFTVQFSGSGFDFGERFRIDKLAASQTQVLQFTNTSGTQTWSGIIDEFTDADPGAAQIWRTGVGGTTILSGDNTVGATYFVTGGTLLVNGNTSNAVAYAVTTGATLGGNGTIGTDNGNVVIGGILDPGSNAAETLTMALGSGELIIDGAEQLAFELGTTSDMILLTSGVLNIGTDMIGFSDFAFSDSGGLAAGTYTLFDTSSTISGTLNGADLSGSIGSFTGTLSFANGDQDIILTVVPEPSITSLIVMALVMFLANRRRQRAAA